MGHLAQQHASREQARPEGVEQEQQERLVVAQAHRVGYPHAWTQVPDCSVHASIIAANSPCDWVAHKVTLHLPCKAFPTVMMHSIGIRGPEMLPALQGMQMMGQGQSG